MLRIKILGIGCARHKALKANLEEALRKYPIKYSLREVTEVNDLIRYGISGTPALVFNNLVVMENQVPNVRDLIALLQKWRPHSRASDSEREILVPTDFSEVSENAFRFAQDLSGYFQANIKVVHVYHPELDMTNPFLVDPLNRELETRKELMGHFIENNRLLQEGNGRATTTKLEIQSHLISGAPSGEIIRMVHREKPELVVMGTTGSTNLASKLFGSVSTDVSQNSESPVLLIPRNATFHGFKKILYASNFNKDDEVMAHRVLEIGGLFSAEIHIVHVENKLNGYQLGVEDFEKLFSEEEQPCTFQFHILKDSNISEGLNRYVQENHIDLVVMLTRQRSFWQNLLHRSVTRRMSLLSTTPLLVINFDI